MKTRKKRLAALSEAQLEIMREVWAGGEVTVTQVWGALNQRRPVARNTVHTLMDRLAIRGWLKRKLAGQTHFYTAGSPRATTLRELAGRLMDTAFGGSLEDFVLALLQGRRLTPHETRRIRKLLDDAKAEDK